MSDRYAPRWDERQQAWQVYNPATQGWYYTKSPPAGATPSFGWEKNTAQQAYVPSTSRNLENNTPPPVNLAPIPKKETPKPKPKSEFDVNFPIYARKDKTVYYIAPQTVRDILSGKYPDLKDVPVQPYNMKNNQPIDITYNLGTLQQQVMADMTNQLYKHGFEQIPKEDLPGTVGWRRRERNWSDSPSDYEYVKNEIIGRNKK